MSLNGMISIRMKGTNRKDRQNIEDQKLIGLPEDHIAPICKHTVYTLDLQSISYHWITPLCIWWAYGGCWGYTPFPVPLPQPSELVAVIVSFQLCWCEGEAYPRLLSAYVKAFGGSKQGWVCVCVRVCSLTQGVHSFSEGMPVSLILQHSACWIPVIEFTFGQQSPAAVVYLTL